MKKTTTSHSVKSAASKKTNPPKTSSKASPARAGVAASGKALPSYTRDQHARGYPDLHDHLAALDKAGLLIKVDRKINKDTEMHPLVRWQFRGGIDRKSVV